MLFIDKIAQTIKNRPEDLQDITIILPSQRAIKYLSNALVRAYGKPIFSPNMFSIDLWVQSIFPHCIDNTRLLLLLYEVHLELENTPETFEEFSKWAPIVLNDFEEIDRQLLNTKDVFQNLFSIKELEAWNVDENKISELQYKFLKFWEKLPLYHEKLFLKLEEKKYTTLFSAYRELAEKDILPESQFFIFAGFNALSTAELKIIRKLQSRGQALFIIDADIYYLEDEFHEAGYFLRKALEFLQLSNPSHTIDKISKEAINLRIVECPQKTGQVKVLAAELARLSSSELEETVVVLADESLLSSVVQNIPSNVGNANITLGLSLSQTPIKSWIELLFSIQENKKRYRTQAIYHSDLMSFFHHVFIGAAASVVEKENMAVIEFKTAQKNKVFQNVASIQISERLNEILGMLTTDWNDDWLNAINIIRRVTKKIIELIPREKEFELNCLLVFDNQIYTFYKIVEEGLPVMNLNSFQNLLFQHWSAGKLSYFGNPTKGLQIMGILETRLLDFKRVLIIGFNEGNIPNAYAFKSLIPMDLRGLLGLPSIKEKQGVSAHHFYRLLHHAQHVTATFSSTSDQLASHEKSRYLLQLELELCAANKNINLRHELYAIPIENITKSDGGLIVKTPFILNKIDKYFSSSISASGINRYLTCPLDFYYKYILQFGEEKNVEEDIETNTFGTLIHNTLEKLYLPYAKYDKNGQIQCVNPPRVTCEVIDDMLIKYQGTLYNEFLSYFDKDETLFKRGKNALSYRVANEMTLKFLHAEKEFIKKLNQPLFIERLEAGLETSFQLEVDGAMKTIKIGGFIDRIDKIGEDYRLLDYKSGKVYFDDVCLKTNKSDHQMNFQKTKHAVQLSFYALMFNDEYGFFPKEIKICSLLEPSLNLPLQGDKGQGIEEITNEAKEFIRKVYSEMIDKSIEFSHASSSLYCKFCD
ncbi:MAG: PD-(D/E)XK nuclease family protein [Bacteroidetes bacterium]|nr:PD-(D/E)XK nuclease family protein [Bacteroidota bacterium]